MKKYIVFLPTILLLISSFVCIGEENWDSGRYIHTNEIKTDMPAYCLSSIKGDKVDKFELKILSIIKNARPSRDMILVVITDERLLKYGAVHGFSGSPVYIDGRLAGAMSAGWDGSLEPLYLVTPIEDMLTIGQAGESSTKTKDLSGINCIDVSEALDLDSICKRAELLLCNKNDYPGKLPFVTNLSAQACNKIAPAIEKLGLIPLAGGAPTGISGNKTIEAGGVLALPLCSGDIQMSVIGTSTEVVGEKVYGFGHSFTSSGAVELPMSSGTVHTIVATYSSSNKLASPGEIIGTVEFDQNTGIVGYVGRMPPLVDLEINISRFDDTQKRTYHCKVARNRELTPVILRSTIIGAATNQGDLPQEHNVRYRCNYRLENSRSIEFGNFSSQESIQAPAMNVFALTSTLMNNPFQIMRPSSITMDIDIQPENREAALWETRLSNTVVRPGETVKIYFRIKEFRNDIRDLSMDLTIPQDCPEGRYAIQISGVEGYQNFLQKTAPQKFTVTDAQSLLDGIQRILNFPADRVYVCMPISQSGISIRNAELANLPASKTVLLTDNKRVQPTTPYQSFIENSIQADFILNGAAAMDIIVVKNP